MGDLGEGETTKGGTKIDEEAQRGGRNGHMGDRVAEMGRGLGQVVIPAE